VGSLPAGVRELAEVSLSSGCVAENLRLERFGALEFPLFAKAFQKFDANSRGAPAWRGSSRNVSMVSESPPK